MRRRHRIVGRRRESSAILSCAPKPRDSRPAPSPPPPDPKRCEQRAAPPISGVRRDHESKIPASGRGPAQERIQAARRDTVLEAAEQVNDFAFPGCSPSPSSSCSPPPPAPECSGVGVIREALDHVGRLCPLLRTASSATGPSAPSAHSSSPPPPLLLLSSSSSHSARAY